MDKFKLSTLALTLVVGILLALIRTVTHPLGLNNYGYDYGFYSYAITHTNLHSLPYLFGQVNDYGNHLHVIFNTLRLPQIPSLEISFYAFGAITIFLLFLYLSKKSLWTSVIGSVWFIFSVAQTQVFTMFLWKTSYGLLLMLLFFIFFESKKYRLASISILLMLISHKTTVVMTLLSTSFYSAVTYIKQKSTLACLLLAGAVIALIYLFPFGGWSDFVQLNHNVAKQGIFMSFKTYLLFSWYLWPFAIYSLYESIKNKTTTLWLWLLVVSFIWIVFGLTLWERMIIYLDLALIIIAARTAGKLIVKLPNIYLKTGVAIMLLAVSLWQYQAWLPSIKPQISESEILEIHNFAGEHQNSFVLALGAKDAPWLLANLSGNIRLGAPGLFEDFATQDDWQTLWINPNNQSFYQHFPSPLYLYQKDNQIYRDEWQCLEQISPHLFRYLCQ